MKFKNTPIKIANNKKKTKNETAKKDVTLSGMIQAKDSVYL